MIRIRNDKGYALMTVVLLAMLFMGVTAYGQVPRLKRSQYVCGFKNQKFEYGGLSFFGTKLQKEARFYVEVKGLKSDAALRYLSPGNRWYDLCTFSGDGVYEVKNVANEQNLVFQNGPKPATVTLRIYRAKSELPVLKAPEGGQRLIGTFYYDGWSNRSIYGMGSESQRLYEAVSDAELVEKGLPKKQGRKDWRDYAKAVTGDDPVKDCSFSMVFPQLTRAGYRNQPSRKPFWGWRHETVADMEQEIELASSYGIDYFMFCFYPQRIADNATRVDDKALRNALCNNALYRFLEAGNKRKMRFAVMIVDHEGACLKTRRQMNLMMDYIEKTFLNDQSYLRMNGSPVVGLYEWGLGDTALEEFRRQECRFLLNFQHPGGDGRMWYGGIRPCGDSGLHRYQELSDYTRNNAVSYMRNQLYELAPVPVMTGWHDWTRADFGKAHDKESGVAYELPTKAEFAKAMRQAVDDAVYGLGDQTVLVYAWNEYGEGGFLPPTYSDLTPRKNDYPAKENGHQLRNVAGQPLYFDFGRLEAVKEAKDYWMGK